MEHTMAVAQYTQYALAVALALPWLALGAMGSIALAWLWYTAH